MDFGVIEEKCFFLLNKLLLALCSLSELKYSNFFCYCFYKHFIAAFNGKP